MAVILRKKSLQQFMSYFTYTCFYMHGFVRSTERGIQKQMQKHVFIVIENSALETRFKTEKYITGRKKLTHLHESPSL